MSTSHRYWPILAALITISIWTSFIVVARASASHHLLPLDILAARVMGAGLLLLPYVMWQRAKRIKQVSASGERLAFGGWSPLPWLPTLAVGVLAGFLYSGLAYTGFFYAPATHASVLLPGALPFWTTLLSVLWLKEKLPRQRWVGLGLIFAGAVLVGSKSISWAGDDPVWVGHMFFLCASLTWSAYGVVVRRYQLHAIDATTALTMTAVFLYLPAYAVAVWVLGVPSHFSVAPWREIVFQTIYQGWGTLVIAGITFNTMVKHYGPVPTTMMTALVPGLSAMSAVLWLGEPMTPVLLGGLALVTSGILVGALQRTPKN